VVGIKQFCGSNYYDTDPDPTFYFDTALDPDPDPIVQYFIILISHTC
jgi:hypothetical protein